MNVGQLSPGEIAGRLRGVGLGIRTGPFHLRIRSDAPAVLAGIRVLYADYPALEPTDFCDYTVGIERVRGLRRWLRPQAQFIFDHEPVFEPLPLSQAMPMAEWAMNWCVGSHAHQFLVLHAAAIERDGMAAVLPAPPGSGKSTLCAGLVRRGWRLLSDELALLSLASGQLVALARPVSLKNQSIDVIRSFAPDAVFSAVTHGTTKGSVAQMRVAAEDLRRVDEPANPAWVVFPRYVPAAPPTLTPRDKAESMLQLSRNAFNSAITGREGFHALADLVERSDCYDFSYSSLDDAVATFDTLARRRQAR